jgi:hypothetical protein
MLAVTAVLVCAAAGSATATDEYDSLLRLVPSDANAVVLINPVGIGATEYAQTQRLAEQRTMKAADHALVVPPGATQFVRGARIDLTTATPVWEVTAVHMKDTITAQQVAKAEGGHADKLGDLEAAFSPRDFVAVVFSDHVIGAYAPADRQTALRWARSANSATKPTLSPYLSSVVDAADLEQTQLVVAIDLEGVISARDILPDVAQAKLVTESSLDPIKVADLVASLKGFTLKLTVSDKVGGMVRMDFGEDAAILAPVARQAVVNAMANHGAYIAEMEAWEGGVEGKSIVLRGDLTTSGTRRIASLLSAPVPDTTHDKEEHSEEKLDPVAATQQHFKAVESMLNDVRRAENADDLSDVAVFLDRYARKIEQLPILNVDPELLGWSEYVSQTLRGASVRLKDVRLNTASRAAEHANFYDTEDTGGAPTTTIAITDRGRYYDRTNYHYDGDNNYRYGNYRTTRLEEVEYGVERYRRGYQEGERRQIAIEERSKGKQEAIRMIEAVENSTADIRRKMTQKYNVEF